MINKKPPKKLKNGETAIYAPNPYYDDILIFAPLQVPTTKESYKLIDHEKRLYQKVTKSNVSEFQKQIRERLLEKKKPWWPFKGDVSAAVTIAGPKSYIKKKDIDNLLKTVLDCLKGIVIEDDCQIVQGTILKSEMPFVHGMSIAIRSETDDSDYIYGEDPDKWEEDTRLKLQRGGICSIDTY
jgi:Holliday junction resolvase RusA-like endonuclease